MSNSYFHIIWDRSGFNSRKIEKEQIERLEHILRRAEIETVRSVKGVYVKRKRERGRPKKEVKRYQKSYVICSQQL